MYLYVPLLGGAVILALAGCQSKPEENVSESIETNTASHATPSKSSYNAVVASAPKPVIELDLAVARSLISVMPILQADFIREHPDIRLNVTYDTAANLYQGITQQPTKYDIYLSANTIFTQKLFQSNITGQFSKPFTFSEGQLVLYSTKHPIQATPTSTLDDFTIDHPQFVVTIADPTISPYGNAAQAWLVNQNLSTAITPHLVSKTSVDEAFSAVDDGSADFGFVTLSQVLGKQHDNSLKSYAKTINYSILPSDSYPPILHEGIVLKPSSSSQAFMQYLLTAKAQDILNDAGYLPICTNTNLLPACKKPIN